MPSADWALLGLMVSIALICAISLFTVMYHEFKEK